jgi:phosphoribosylaminoimidazole-succinocarboxamide synthase
VKRLELRYEGKAKRVYSTKDPNAYVVEFKDDATAFNALKRGTIEGKGEINNSVTTKLYRVLEREGVPTHFLQKLNEREQLVRAVRIIPVEVIVRNVTAGTFATRYGVEEGLELEPPVIEWCLKSDALSDPPMNDDTAVALGFATREQLAELRRLAQHVNQVLERFFGRRGIRLVDFKLEFGVTNEGRIVLADEISPDTCRLWDASSGERMDKDRFRRDLGNVEEAYREVLRRVMEEYDV